MKEISLPEWYNCQPLPEEPHSSRHRHVSVVRRALASIGDVLARELSGVQVHESWLSRVEPRARVLGIICLIFATTLLHGLGSLTALFVLLCAAMLSMRLPISRIARAWVGVPLFSLALVLPATLNLVTPGHSVFTIIHLEAGASVFHWRLPETISITGAGLFVATRFLIRIIDCITLSFLLVSSTDSATLVNSMRRLGMPKVFGMVLAMMQRYLTVLLRAAEEIHQARLSRPSGEGSIRSEHRWVAAGMGILFRRTHRLTEEIGLAMISRGYDGDLQITRGGKWRPSDTAWLAGVIAVTAGILVVDRLL